jgi:probable HAF family extracellular repeat protein
VGQVFEAFLYSNGSTVYLPPLGAPSNGTASSDGIAINNLGEVAGWTTVTESYGVKPFLYSNGTVQILGTFAGLDTESDGEPTDINNLGQVVGFATASAGGEYLAFLYSNGHMQDLGTLGGQFSMANGINDSGEVVGVSDTVKSGFEGADAFLYSGGEMYNLNSLIGKADSAVWLTSATAINDQGLILADGVDIYNHEYYTYLLTPTNTPPTCGTLCKVPEPSSLGLFGCGLLGFGAAILLRRRQRALREPPLGP